MFILFEGLDKSGKTTLEWELLKATNFKYVVIDRGPAGYLTFDTIFDRFDSEDIARAVNYVNDISTIKDSKNFFIVYCKVSEKIAMERLKAHNEECPYDYKEAQCLYDKNIKNLYQDYGIAVLELDTSESIDVCIKTIMQKIEEALKSEHK